MKGTGIFMTFIIAFMAAFGGIFLAVKFNAFGIMPATVASQNAPAVVKESYSPNIDITTNLKSADGSKSYIKTTIVVTVNGKNDLKKVTDSEAILRDAYLQVLNNLTIEEANDPSKINDVKKQLIDNAEKKLQIRIYNLYFLDYVTQ